MIINKSMSVQVQIKDNESNKSRCFTIHGRNLENVFCNLLFYAQMLSKYDEIKLICYKKINDVGDENEKDVIDRGKEIDIN